jgi:hypothetical protein
MLKDEKLTSGQINFQCQKQRNAYSCIVIKDGVFHNMSERHRLELIRILENSEQQPTKSKEDVDLESMF